MTYVFDIDGTICTLSNGDYDLASPIKERINIVNELYDKGNKIIFLTARGMGRTGNNREIAYELFYEKTKSQLSKWGVKYNELHLGKPAGDLYVDDKGIKDTGFFSNQKG